MKIVVVGANHAGTACINTMLDNYKGNEVVVFDSNSNISFLGCGMALWIGGQIAGSDGLFYSSKESWSRYFFFSSRRRHTRCLILQKKN